MITRPNQQKVAELAKVHQRCKVLRDHTWKEVDVSEIVPWNVGTVELFSLGLPDLIRDKFRKFRKFLLFLCGFFCLVFNLKMELCRLHYL